MLNRSGKSGLPCSVPVLREKVFRLSPLNTKLTVGFNRCVLSAWGNSLLFLVDRKVSSKKSIDSLIDGGRHI